MKGSTKGETKSLKVQLYNQSCFTIMKDIPDASIDLVLIDPPYVISRETGFQAVVNGVERFAVSMEFGEWDKKFDGLNIVIHEAYRILKKGGTFICFYDLWKITELKRYLEDSKFKQIRLVEWIKTNPVPLNSKVNYLSNAREIALLGVKGSKPTFNSEYDTGIYQYPINHEKGRFHPTQKPLAFMEELVKKHSNEGEVVADFFSGSGTTALAAYKQGRNFIGCELEEIYYSKSLARLKHFDKNMNIETEYQA